MNAHTEPSDGEVKVGEAGQLPLPARVAAWNRTWERLLAPPGHEGGGEPDGAIHDDGRAEGFRGEAA